MVATLVDLAPLANITLIELSSLLVNMNAEAQLAIATPLRTAVWNWIEHFTDDFNECTRARGRLEGAPERVFDLFYSKVQPGTEKLMWPLLTVLGCISSDRLSIDVDSLTMGGVGAARGHRFCSEILKHARGHTKLAEVSMVSALDICRAAIFLRPEGEVPLRMLAHDIAHEVKVRVLRMCTGSLLMKYFRQQCGRRPPKRSHSGIHLKISIFRCGRRLSLLSIGSCQWKIPFPSSPHVPSRREARQ